MLLFNQDEESRLAVLHDQLKKLEARRAGLKSEASTRFHAALSSERPPAALAPATAAASAPPTGGSWQRPASGFWHRLTRFFRGAAGPAGVAALPAAQPSAAPAKPVALIRFESAEEKLIPNEADPAQPAEMKTQNQAHRATDARVMGFTSMDSTPSTSTPCRRSTVTMPFPSPSGSKLTRVHPRAVVASRSRSGIDSAMRGFELILEENRPSLALVHFSPGNEIRIAAAKPFRVNEWTHLAATYDGSSRAAGLTLYVNGRPVEARIVRDSLYRDIVYREKWGDSTEKDSGDRVLPFSLGARFNDASFTDGTVDDFRFFPRLPLGPGNRAARGSGRGRRG